MATYLDLLNRARQRQAGLPISLTAIGDNSGDSLQGIAAVRNAVAVFYENSFDLDADEKIADVTTNVGTSLLTAPVEAWDTNIIKSLKYLKPGNDYLIPLSLITLEQSVELQLKAFSSNEPQYWWVNNMNVYVLPVPTAAYLLKVHYQKIYPDITSDNISSTVMLPSSALKILEDGIYADLRNNAGDPAAPQYKQEFERQVAIFYQRNKNTYKRQGVRRFRVVPISGDRRPR